MTQSMSSELTDNSFLCAIRSAKQILGAIETGLTAKSEFELYFQTDSKTLGNPLDISSLHKRAQNLDIRHSKIRSVYWKVFLGLIDIHTSEWKNILTRKRNKYNQLKQKYIKNTMHEQENNQSNIVIDNPLLSSTGGTWDNYYKDIQLKHEIFSNIRRTYPVHDFFRNKFVQNSLTNILFIYCKEHKHISYKTDMNVIVATLFIVNTMQSTIHPYIDKDPKLNSCQNENVNIENNGKSLWEITQNIEYLEHDTYYMLIEIMNVMSEYFIDKKRIIKRSANIQTKLLPQIDPKLAQHLSNITLVPHTYGMQWIRLLFTHEFHLSDVCVIWDAIFGTYSERKTQKQNSKKIDFRFMDYMSCSMLLFIRHQLIDRDISHCIQRVIKYPPIEDIASLVERAYIIKDQIEKRYKTQNENKKEKKWTSSELLSQFKIPVKWSSDELLAQINNNYQSKSNSSKEHKQYKHNRNHTSIDWLSRDHNKSKHSRRSSLPNFSPLSMQKVPAAKYGKTQSELHTKKQLQTNSESLPSNATYVSDMTKNVIGGAVFAVSGIASSLWSSYGTKVVSNSIDKSMNVEKKYKQKKQNVKKQISAVKSVKYKDIVNTYPTVKTISKLTNLPMQAKSTMNKLSQNVLKPLYQINENKVESDDIVIENEVSDFLTYTPPKLLPFEKRIKPSKEQNVKLKLISHENNEQEYVTDESTDDEMDLLSNVTVETNQTKSSTDIIYNLNMTSFSIDNDSRKNSLSDLMPMVFGSVMPNVTNVSDCNHSIR